jgi:excisionase family DNA binding protein
VIADADAGRPDALVPRCSTATAAKYLGCSARFVEKLIRAGALDAWDVRSPGAKRARYAVVVASIRAFLEDRHQSSGNSEPRTAEPFTPVQRKR